MITTMDKPLAHAHGVATDLAHAHGVIIQCSPHKYRYRYLDYSDPYEPLHGGNIKTNAEHSTTHEIVLRVSSY